MSQTLKRLFQMSWKGFMDNDRERDVCTNHAGISTIHLLIGILKLLCSKD